MPEAPLQVTLDLHEIEQFIQRFPISGPQVAEDRLRYALNDALEFTLNNVVDRTPVNTGGLRGSEYTEVRGVKANLYGVEVSGVVSSHDTEGKVAGVEFGRAAGKMPPVEAIALWVKRKGLAGTYKVEKNKKGTHNRVGNAKRKASEDLSLAWAIAIHISKFGTKGAHMFRDGAQASQEYIFNAFDSALNDILNKWAKI